MVELKGKPHYGYDYYYMDMVSSKLKWMDKTSEQYTIEGLYPLVRIFKEKLTAVEWEQLELGAIEKTLEVVIKHCCMQIVVTAVKYRDCIVCKEPKADLPTHLSQTYSGCNGFQNLTLPEQKVLKSLGDSIFIDNTEMKVALEAIWDCDKEAVIEFLMKKITHVVTAELLHGFAERGSNSGGDEEKSKPLDALCLTIMLDKNLDFLVEMLQRHTAWISCLPTLHDSPDYQMAVAEQDTPVTPATPEREISAFMVSTTVKVTKILEKVASNINVIDSEGKITLEGCNKTLQMILRDTQNVARDIVQLISDKKLDQEIVGDCKSELKINNQHQRKEAQGKISALLIRSFTKMSVINLVTKLRGKHECVLSTEGHQSLLRLLDGVDHLVDKIMLLDDEQKTMKEVEECQYSRAARKFSVERQKLIRKRLCTLTLGYLNRENGKTVCSKQKIQVEVNACMEEIVKWLNFQARQHDQNGGITLHTLEEIHRELASFFPTEEKPMTEETTRPETNNSPTRSPSNVSDEDEDKPPANADPVLEGLCSFVVTQLVKKILGYFQPNEASAIVQKLKEMLLAELTGFEIVVELNDTNTKKIVKAVERELLRRMGSSGLVKQAMWAKREWVFHCIVEHLKTLLLTPLRTSRRSIFLDMYFKPLSRCFRRCSTFGNREHHV